MRTGIDTIKTKAAFAPIYNALVYRLAWTDIIAYVASCAEAFLFNFNLDGSCRTVIAASSTMDAFLLICVDADS